MIRKILYLIIAFPLLVVGQSNELENENRILGYAPAYLGHKVEVFKTLDYVTGRKKLITTDTVSPKDSTFRLTIPNKGTQKFTFKIDDKEAELYMNPSKKYAFKFPKAKEESDLLDRELDLILIGVDSTDINYKIASFDLWQDRFFNQNYDRLMTKKFSSELDTFKNYVQEYYKGEKDLYFLNYVKFSLAEMEQINQVKNELMRRFVIYINYIRGQSILYGHDKYISFLKNFYKKQFKRYGEKIRYQIDEAIAKASPSILDTIMRKDKLLENSLIREFAMIVNLGEQFYKFNYNPNNVLTMLDSLHNHAKYKNNGEIAGHILEIIRNRSAGFHAPRFKVGTGEKSLTNKDFKGKYLYMQFFTTWDETAKKELKIMKKLYKKYGKDIEFLSIAVDEDVSGYQQFIKSHDFSWSVRHVSIDSDVVDRYKIKSTPTYFLIDPDGILMQSPALMPSPGGEYETIDKTFFYINKRLHPPESKGRSY